MARSVLQVAGTCGAWPRRQGRVAPSQAQPGRPRLASARMRAGPAPPPAQTFPLSGSQSRAEGRPAVPPPSPVEKAPAAGARTGLPRPAAWPGLRPQSVGSAQGARAFALHHCCPWGFLAQAAVTLSPCSPHRPPRARLPQCTPALPCGCPCLQGLRDGAVALGRPIYSGSLGRDFLPPQPRTARLVTRPVCIS